MSRLSPKNKEEALTYQLEDIVKTLRGFSPYPDLIKEYDKQLQLLKSHIKIYENGRRSG